jgi:hypothetical protein
VVVEGSAEPLPLTKRPGTLCAARLFLLERIASVALEAGLDTRGPAVSAKRGFSAA